MAKKTTITNLPDIAKKTKDNWIWQAIFILGVAGILFIGFLSLSYGEASVNGSSNYSKFASYFITFGIALVISGACFCFGALMGFLFGIPRIINSSTAPSSANGTVLQNDNLVQISDWLTKILVGVGLTQIYQIPGFLKKIGDFLAPCFSNGNVKSGIGSVIAISLVLYFLILGFMACYLWTRFYFSEMLEDSLEENDDDEKKPTEDNVNKMVNTTVHHMTINPDAATLDPLLQAAASSNVPAPASDSNPAASTDPVSPVSPVDASSDSSIPVPDNSANVPDASVSDASANLDADPGSDAENPPFNPADANSTEDTDTSGDPDLSVKP